MKIALSLLVAACLLGLGLSTPTPLAKASPAPAPAPAPLLQGLVDNILTPLLCGIADILGKVITGVLLLVAGLAHGILN